MKNKFLSYANGILFGLLFSIPWLLVYILADILVGYLAILIVIGIILGYKMIQKDIYNTKQTRIYLILSSLFIVYLNIFLIMPFFIQFVNQDTVTIDFLAKLYNTKEFIMAIIVESVLATVIVTIPAVTLPIDFKRGKNKL